MDSVEILIVEDNESDAEMTIRALKKKQFSQQYFTCGRRCGGT